jgi:hypothetical protein
MSCIHQLGSPAVFRAPCVVCEPLARVAWVAAMTEAGAWPSFDRKALEEVEAALVSALDKVRAELGKGAGT